MATQSTGAKSNATTGSRPASRLSNAITRHWKRFSTDVSMTSRRSRTLLPAMILPAAREAVEPTEGRRCPGHHLPRAAVQAEEAGHRLKPPARAAVTPESSRLKPLPREMQAFVGAASAASFSPQSMTAADTSFAILQGCPQPGHRAHPPRIPLHSIRATALQQDQAGIHPISLDVNNAAR